MASGKSPEELPPGWKESVKVSNGRKIKYYTNLATGQKFYSRKSVIRFVNSLETYQVSSLSTSKPDNGSTPCKSKATSDDIKRNESPATNKPDNGSLPSESKATSDDIRTYQSPEWLPQGWTMESRVRKTGLASGSAYKIYTDPVTGSKFYSKPQVMKYLQGLENKNAGGEQKPQTSEDTPLEHQDMSVHCESVEGKTHSSRENKSGVDKRSFKNVEENNGLDELPRGGIREIRTRRHGRGIIRGQQTSEETPLKQQDMSLDCESEKGKIHSSGENKSGVDKPSLKNVKVNNGSDELRGGVIREIRTRSRSRRIIGQQDTTQDCESIEDKNNMSGVNENNFGSGSLKIDYSDLQKNWSDGLPPGWKKESKTRKCGSAIKKDPYYIDTASGYAFRSKKDVMRYLETGDIRSCVMKPHKWNTSELKLIKDVTNPSTPEHGNKSEESAPRGQLCAGQKPENAGEECSQTSTATAAEANKSKHKKGNSVYGGIAALAVKLTASAIEETLLGSGMIECDKSEENLDSKAEGTRQDTRIVHDNVALNITDTDDLHEQNRTENCLDSQTKKDSRKFKKREPLSVPGRSSKRLAGHEPEVQPNFNLTERALRAAAKKPLEVEADRSPSMAMNIAANEVPQQPFTEAETTSSSLALKRAVDDVPQPLVAETETTISSALALNTEADKLPKQPVTEAETIVAHHTSLCAEASLGINSENQVLQQTTAQASERQVEENSTTRGDYWSDPCWDFAFKTLTGAIPLDDALSIPGCFPQQTGTSYTQDNSTFGLPEFEIPPIFQNDVPPTDLVQNNSPTDQLSTNPTLAPPGNISLPGCTSEPPSLEARSQDYQTKVNS